MKDIAQFELNNLTVEEAIQLQETVHDEDIPIIRPSVYIAQPEPSALTDENSADEDTGGLADSLCGRQLTATVQIRISGVDPGRELLESSRNRD
ncbi:unnamed protein product [Hermetia illucens]|uniref:Uncharacterized protein n=1 Tax=Hermetia illucens TaxID=343691 RepID=A0A7R8UN18_HERIL|nr:unnamed protein product [Hermetia illucens]